MAYRPLVKGDKVRIVDRGVYHGMDAIVVDVEGKVALVDVTGYDYKKGKTVEDRINILQKHLIVRDDHVYSAPFYGKTNTVGTQYPYEDYEEELEEACGECECCKWHIAQNC